MSQRLIDGDIANRPRDELIREIEDLKRYETNFQAMIEGSLDAILVVDTNGAILYANRAAERLFQMPGHSMIGAVFGFPIVLNEPVEMYVLRHFEKFVAVEMWVVQLQWKDRPAYLISLRDITRIVKTREELRRYKDHLEQEVRMRTQDLAHLIMKLQAEANEHMQAKEALSEAKAQAELYLDLMCHDINNLNHTALGYLELALETLETDGNIKLDDKVLIEKPLQVIQNSSTLISNVRKLQRLMAEGVKTQPVDLYDLFEELKVHDFHATDKNFTINIEKIPHYLVEGNELLQDVFYNLIDNAVKHSIPDQPITVDVHVERANEDNRTFYKCIIEDNGPGIPDELKPKLFHRFQRGKTKAHGKGLGLYLVRTLVEGYHGKVWVEDRVPGDYSKGARFVILLPAIEK